MTHLLPEPFLSFARAAYGRLRMKRVGKPRHANGRSCLLIMNGPSLTENEGWLKSRATDAAVAVNHFADSEYFERVRPEIYVIQDSYFWQRDVTQAYQEKRDGTFKALKEKTDWRLKVFLPNRCDRKSWMRDQLDNPNINVRFWNANFIQRRRGEGGLLSTSRVLFRLWKSELAAPPPDNVLVAALYLSERLGFSTMDIIGADFSFFREMQVDQQTNLVGRNVAHFYGEEFRPISKGKTGEHPTSMAHEMLRWHRAFRSLEVISAYLRKQGIEVSNRSAHSYIDCFPRA